MALPILDGNQTAATLSTVLTSGEHIPAHTVVSLGSVAISNITSAVSGSVVSVSNFPSTQTIAGTVTANGGDFCGGFGGGLPSQLVAVAGYDAPNGELGPVPIYQGLADEVTRAVGIRGTVTANVQSLPIIFSGANVGTLGSGNFITDGGGTSNDLGFGIAYNTDATDPGYAKIVSENNPFPISGTVTANVGTVDQFALQGALDQYAANYSDGWPVKPADGNTLPISGTVTANVPDLIQQGLFNGENYKKGVVALGTNYDNDELVPLGVDNFGRISGTVTANLSQNFVSDDAGTIPNYAAAIGFGNESGDFSLVRHNAPLPISGTVTANNPNGALTTRFGSVATANLAFITSAVTNTSRKYLLAQNISAGTVTIGIGFSPTTTQGIQLSAGGGLTFDAFCPTGAVYWLGAVTGANYCLIEG